MKTAAPEKDAVTAVAMNQKHYITQETTKQENETQ